MGPVLATTDLTASGQHAVTSAWMLAARHGVPLRAVHVVPEDLPAASRDYLAREAESVLRAQLEAASGGAKAAAPPQAEPRTVVGRAFEAIVAQADEIDAGLIVLGDHRRDAVRDIFIGATIERVLRTTERPVLLVRRPWAPAPREILAATDFSVGARHAAATAARLFPDARLALVHVFDIPFSGLLSALSAQTHEAQFRGMVADEMKGFAAGLDLGGRPVEQALRSGPVVATILEEAKRRQVDLLAIGTHGRVGLGRAILGSVAEDLIHRTECDILAVRGW